MNTDGQMTTPTPLLSPVNATWLLWRRNRNVRRELTHTGMHGAAFLDLGDLLRYVFRQTLNDASVPVTWPCRPLQCCASTLARCFWNSTSGQIDASCQNLHTVRDQIQQGSHVICQHSCKSSSCSCAHFQILQQPVVIPLKKSFRLEIHQSCWHDGGCRSGFYNSLKVLASSGVRHPPSKTCQAAEAVSMWIRISRQLSVRLNPCAFFASDPDGARLVHISSWLSMSSSNL